MDKKIKLEELSVGYDTPVVSNLSFSVEPGEIYALIGPNGAGKSTVLKTITRQLNRINGKIYISNEDESQMSEESIAKVISMVMTERIHPELMTCFDIVATGRYPYTGALGLLKEEDKAKVLESIHLVGAEAVLDKDFSKISDGQRQRVMLARAICQEPEIMILDEPTSFLDVQYKLDLLALIKRLSKERNIAVIMSIHELEFVPAIADKVVAVDGNRQVFVGTPDEIITGENMEKLYHMKPGTGEILVEGLMAYSKNIESLI
ncbi:ABC-type cobalamin/Fe3+-siderophores transport system, ATPase component [Pseudobutyrivibrio sp. YE44]|uniref:ABC transporter ATP-binding protein n=1 Tax=Pseudobutyrivibrio sp. YE44 TaxID=1520802 RepID=UPI00088148B4|nr:ABC transporter ATP-binding protein [Pseudobutyrivibrio sp. YE44]SDB05817.1 ABC-type cobalamin/Fe3+-siderophores transport system, ATPase component [Pseudobutyrivibrio sp. YE44]